MIVSLTKHLESNPQNHAAWNNLAIARWESGDAKQALSDFASAIRCTKDDPLPLRNRGLLLKSLVSMAQAIEDLRRAITMAPYDPYLRRCRTHAYLETGELEHALSNLTSAIELEPAFRQQYYDRANVYERLGYTEKAQHDRMTAESL